MTPESANLFSLRRVTGALAGLVLSILLVGIVSGTPIRHLIQVVPGIIALSAAIRHLRWAAEAACPLFIIWLCLMSAIWMHLLGLAHLLSGQFTPIDNWLTIIIGICCLWGLVVTARAASSASAARRWLVIAGFALLQLAALWTSFQPLVARH